VFGLEIKYFPASFTLDAGTLVLSHKIALDHIILTKPKQVKCWAEEVG
jgi:hypothetical protein